MNKVIRQLRSASYLLMTIRLHSKKVKYTFGGIDPSIFDRVSETMFTRYVLGLQLVSARPGNIVVKMPYNKLLSGSESLNQVEPGAIGTLMDHTGGITAWTTLTKPSQLVSTVDLRIDFVSGVSCGDTVICEAKVIESNDKFIRTDIACWNESRTQLISIGRGLFNIYMSPLAKIPISGAWMETVALSLPSSTTAGIVRLIERLVVLRLKFFPRKVSHGEHHKHFRTNVHKNTLPNSQSHNKYASIYSTHDHDLNAHHDTSHQNTSTAMENMHHSNRHQDHHTNHILSERKTEEQMNSLEEFQNLEDPMLFGQQSLDDFVSYCEMTNTFIRDVLELRIVGIHTGLAIVSLPFKKRFIGNFFIPCLHGGVIAAVMKSAAVIACKTIIDMNNYRLQVLNAKVSYLKPAPCEEMVCEAEIIDKNLSEYDNRNNNNDNNGVFLVKVCAWDTRKKMKIAVGTNLVQIIAK